jgi:hypothetical protein
VQRELQDEQDSSREKYMNQEKLVEDQLRILQMEVERLNLDNQVHSIPLFVLFSYTAIVMYVGMYVCMYGY